MSTSYRNLFCANPQLHDCEYYTEGSFNNRLVDLNINTNNRGNLALLHLNIHSISYKLDRFSNFLGSVALKFSVIGICETWLDDSSHSCDIIGFNFFHNHRVGMTSGGVGLYLSDYLEFKNRVALVFSKDCAESLFVEIFRLLLLYLGI